MKKFKIGDTVFHKASEYSVAGLEPGTGYSNEFVRIINDRGASRIVHHSELSTSTKKVTAKKVAPSVPAEEILAEPVVSEKPKAKKTTTKKKSTASKKK